MILRLVADGFYWMGDPETVVCCGCFKSVKITYDTRGDHVKDVPDCFLLYLNLIIGGEAKPACVGMFSAEERLKEVLRNHRRIYSIASRSRTFGSSNYDSIAAQGFVKKGDAIECTYCHFFTKDTNEDTLNDRHAKNCPNCIFIVMNN